MTRKTAVPGEAAKFTAMTAGDQPDYFAKAYAALLDAVSPRAAVLCLKAALRFGGFQSKRGAFYATNEEMGELAACSARQAMRLARELEAAGWWKLVKLSRDGKSANMWRYAETPGEATANARQRGDIDVAPDTGAAPAQAKGVSLMSTGGDTDVHLHKTVSLDGPTFERSSKTVPPVGSGSASADDGVFFSDKAGEEITGLESPA